MSSTDVGNNGSVKNTKDHDNVDDDNDEMNQTNRVHFCDTLRKHGYISQRVVDLVRENNVSILDLKNKSRIFDKGPVLYYESIGMESKHLCRNGIDEMRPNVTLSVRKQHNNADIIVYKCTHVGYLYNHLVYNVVDSKNKTKYGSLFRNEHKQKAILLNHGDSVLDGSYIDMIFNVLEKGSKPDSVHVKPKSNHRLQYVSKEKSPTLIVFNDSIDAPTVELHRIYMRFCIGSSVIGYLQHASRSDNTYEINVVKE